MLYGGRSAIGAVISSEVDVGRWAAEVARRAVQPRGLGAYAAFLGGIHAGGYGNDGIPTGTTNLNTTQAYHIIIYHR